MIIPAAIFVVVFLFILLDAHATGDTWSMSAWLGFMGGFISACLISVLIWFGLCFAAQGKPYEVKSSFDIVSMQDGSGVEGHFGLFSGYIDEKIRYYYYYPTGESSYKQGWVGGNVKIIEDAKPNHGYIAVLGREELTTVPWFPSFSVGGTHYEIHVPPGTVIQQMTLDTSAS